VLGLQELEGLFDGRERPVPWVGLADEIAVVVELRLPLVPPGAATSDFRVGVKEDVVRVVAVAVVAAGLLIGCDSEQVSSSGDDGDCISFYEPFVFAATRADLRQRLLEDVSPAVRSLRVIDKDPDDGTWTAQQWNQCID
jgi:hypothetical protein